MKSPGVQCLNTSPCVMDINLIRMCVLQCARIRKQRTNFLFQCFLFKVNPQFTVECNSCSRSFRIVETLHELSAESKWYTEWLMRVVARVESKHRFPTLKSNRSTAGIGSGSRVRQAFTCTPFTVLLRGRVTFARDRGRHNGLPVGLFPTRCSRVTH